MVNTAEALSPHKAISQYIRDQWSAEQGFPGGRVYAIAQTPDGYLWIGTEKGLVRFDGITFRLLQHSGSAEFPSGAVLGLAVDADGNLWVRLQGTRLLRYKDGSFYDVLRDLPVGDPHVTAMCVAKNGDVLFSVLANGTNRYSKGQIAPVVSPNELPDLVMALAEAADGKIWIGTREQGLYYVSQGRVLGVNRGLPDRKINALLPIDSHELWISTDNGVAHWNGSELSRTGLPRTLEHIQALAMIRDLDSNLWIGTSSGLVRITAKGDATSDQGSNGSRAVTALFEDRERNLWVGTALGIERFRDSVFATYSVSNGLPSDNNGPVYVDAEGRTWFAPKEGGLYWLKEGRVGAVTGGGLDKDVVYSIDGGKSGLWIGRQRGGLTQLHGSGDSFTAKNYTASEGLAQNSVYAVHENRDGTVWAGAISRGLSRFKNGSFSTYTIANGLLSNTITSIMEASDGAVWVGTPNGLNVFSNGQWRAYTAKDGLPPGDVKCLLEDSTGIRWIGTANGLAFQSSGKVYVPRGVPELLHDQIFGIEEDTTGSLWVATANHILQIDRDKMLHGKLTDADVREYGLADGLLSKQGVDRHRSVVADSVGRIWISTNRGVSFVDPGPTTGASIPAIIHIEGISANGRQIGLAQHIRIPAPHQRITLNYTGLSLAAPTHVRYKYRLDGFDESWSEPVSTREAVYTNLSPGSYRFRIVATNSIGIWNSSEAALPFEIEPAYWQTWWFRTGYVALILLTVWCAHQYGLHLTAKQFNMRLKERVSERTRIARELHDTLLQSFHAVLLRFQAASNVLLARPEEAKQRLDSAIDQAAQAIAQGRDAVEGLRSSAATDDLAMALRSLGEELAADETNQNSADFDVQVEGPPRELRPILRDEVYRIAGEALRNAFRHAQARRIELEIRYAENQLRLRIRDDGKGIDSPVLDGQGRPGHWGLPGMRERTKLVGGNLEVWSKLHQGTEIELTIPASTAYASSRIRRRWWFSKRGTAMRS